MANRDNIYYWKCDRPLAFFAIDKKCDTSIVEESLNDLLRDFFHGEYSICPACGQGNHLTYLAQEKGKTYFIRLENGPECDDYMEVEAFIMNQVRKVGIPTPEIYAVDSSRRKYPFAYQIMENLDYDDLNKIYQRNDLDTERVMHKLGFFVATWQSIACNGFGLFNSERLRSTGELVGLHSTYEAYYRLNLSKHLDFLIKNEFLTEKHVQEIMILVDQYQSLLQISQGCLVHKDLALWNVLGSKTDISSVIDWDDSISGDPTDDLSLMACFHSGKELTSLLEGYQEIKELPENFEKRFWLHLLRNMIFKAVIRVGAGYFKKSSDFFLVNKENNLKTTTQDRIFKAIEGLKGNIKISDI